MVGGPLWQMIYPGCVVRKKRGRTLGDVVGVIDETGERSEHPHVRQI